MPKGIYDRSKKGKCNICSVELTVENTYKGQQNRLCIAHLREYSNKQRHENLTRFKIYRLKYEKTNNKTKKRREQLNEISHRMRGIYPEKWRAREQLRYAVKIGKVKKLSCIDCGSNKVEAHHTDYSKPLDVIWYCKKHHMFAHNKFIEL